MAKVERRCGLGPGLGTARSQQSKAGPVISGYAAIFNREADLGLFREVIAAGAFSRAIRERQDIRALFNHDPSLILGRLPAGTLRLREDGRGLFYEIDAPDSQLGRNLVESIRRGDVSQSSFAFIVVGERWESKAGVVLRIIEDVDLLDVSPVTFPAYESTSVNVNSAQNAQGDWRADLHHYQRRLRLHEMGAVKWREI